MSIRVTRHLLSKLYLGILLAKAEPRALNKSTFVKQALRQHNRLHLRKRRNSNEGQFLHDLHVQRVL
jgi:hypothetical protein